VELGFEDENKNKEEEDAILHPLLITPGELKRTGETPVPR
jgi:hypothetical protein